MPNALFSPRYSVFYLCGATEKGGPLKILTAKPVWLSRRALLRRPDLYIAGFNLQIRDFLAHGAIYSQHTGCPHRHAIFRVNAYSSPRLIWRYQHPALEKVDELEIELAELTGFEGADAVGERADLEAKIRDAYRLILLQEATLQDAHAAGLVADAARAVAVARYFNDQHYALAEQLRREMLPPPDAS